MKWLNPIPKKSYLPSCYSRMVAELDAAFKALRFDLLSKQSHSRRGQHPIDIFNRHEQECVTITRILAHAKQAVERDREGFKPHRCPDICDIEAALETVQQFQQEANQEDAAPQERMPVIAEPEPDTPCSDPWEFVARLFGGLK